MCRKQDVNAQIAGEIYAAMERPGADEDLLAIEGREAAIQVPSKPKRPSARLRMRRPGCSWSGLQGDADG